MSQPTIRPYQHDLIERVIAARRNGARIIVVQATTGAGKTTVACRMTELALAKSSRVLFLVHRRKLVDQISERLRDFSITHGVIMAGEHQYGSASVQVASRDTILSRVFNNQWQGLPPAELVFVDEGHRAADENSEYRKILACYPTATIILLTATPVGPDGRGLGPFAQAIECAAPTSQLIKDGFLVPVRCYAPDRKIKNGKVKTRGLAGDFVDAWKEFACNLPTVLFTSRVSHSKDAVAAFKAEGIRAAHVDANTSDEDRDNIFAGLGTGLVQVVSNVGIIKEGTDIPCLGCCQLYMEMNGRVSFLQAVGRIMRPHPGKTHGVLIDHAGVVYRHGFPDEDTEWTLQGNADDDFRKKKKDDKAKKVNYCSFCKILFSETVCPQCLRIPVKPPRSIFLPPPVTKTNEIITEAERGGLSAIYAREEKIKHWFRCLAVSANSNGTFGKAAMIYKQKYGDWPDESFPCNPGRFGGKKLVRAVYPQFGKKKKV